MITVRRIPVGVLQVNCYLVAQGDQALVVDPGDEPQKLIDTIDELHLKPVGILLTHAHVDHIRGVSDVAARYGLAVWCHPGDRALYASPANAILPWIPAAEDLPELSDNPPALDGAPYTVISTPGHTPGSVCFHFPESRVLLTGDTLFKGPHGRTDFSGGCEQDIHDSTRLKLYTLPEATVVYPGHMEQTTIGDEKRTQFH